MTEPTDYTRYTFPLNGEIDGALTTLTIGSSCTYLPAYVFCGQKKLQSITISENITAIHDRAFFLCSGLKSITVKSATPPTMGEEVFGECAYENDLTQIDLYYPSSAETAYRHAEGWKEFFGVESGLSEILAGTHSNGNKVMIDGQVYILCNGKAYNLFGEEAK